MVTFLELWVGVYIHEILAPVANMGGFQSRDETAMLVHKTIANIAHVLHKNRVKFPKAFFLYCSVHQHGCCDVR